jgi:hypothetical protein
MSDKKRPRIKAIIPIPNKAIYYLVTKLIKKYRHTNTEIKYRKFCELSSSISEIIARIVINRILKTQIIKLFISFIF